MRKLFSFFIGSQPHLIRLLEGGKCPEILLALCSSNAAPFRARKSVCILMMCQNSPMAGLFCLAAPSLSLHFFQRAGIGGESKTDVLRQEQKD